MQRSNCKREKVKGKRQSTKDEKVKSKEKMVKGIEQAAILITSWIVTKI